MAPPQYSRELDGTADRVAGKPAGNPRELPGGASQADTGQHPTRLLTCLYAVSGDPIRVSDRPYKADVEGSSPSAPTIKGQLKAICKFVSANACNSYPVHVQPKGRRRACSNNARGRAGSSTPEPPVVRRSIGRSYVFGVRRSVQQATHASRARARAVGETGFFSPFWASGMAGLPSAPSAWSPMAVRPHGASRPPAANGHGGDDFASAGDGGCHGQAAEGVSLKPCWVAISVAWSKWSFRPASYLSNEANTSQGLSPLGRSVERIEEG